MAKETYAQQIINEVPGIISEIKANIEGENYSAKKCSELRANLNAGIIMAVFGAEITETKDGLLALTFNKKPATSEELSTLAKQLQELVTAENNLRANMSEEDDDMDIPTEVSGAVMQLIPDKVNKKTLTEYLLNSPQAIGKLQIGPCEILTLAALSEKYRKNRKTTIILVSAIVAAVIAAGVTTTVILVNNHKKKVNDIDDNPDAIDITEDDIIPEEDVQAADSPVPHVELDM